jgi:hypothetical protein
MEQRPSSIRCGPLLVRGSCLATGCGSEGGSVILRTIEGVYRNSKEEFTEVPSDVREEMRVLVTFLEPQHIDLRARGIDEAQAAELRTRLATFAEDRDSPEMAVYDDYDAVKARLQTR